MGPLIEGYGGLQVGDDVPGRSPRNGSFRLSTPYLGKLTRDRMHSLSLAITNTDDVIANDRK